MKFTRKSVSGNVFTTYLLLELGDLIIGFVGETLEVVLGVVEVLKRHLTDL